MNRNRVLRILKKHRSELEFSDKVTEPVYEIDVTDEFLEYDMKKIKEELYRLRDRI